MDNNNESAKGRKRAGRPEQPLDVEIEFIDDGEAGEDGIRFLTLLERHAIDPSEEYSSTPTEINRNKVTCARGAASRFS